VIHGVVNVGAASPQAGDALNCIGAALQARLTPRPRSSYAPQRAGESMPRLGLDSGVAAGASRQVGAVN
jgi:hypothetical protein